MAIWKQSGEEISENTKYRVYTLLVSFKQDIRAKGSMDCELTLFLDLKKLLELIP